jgi:demethylmenaquinone methyltransferase / 2-methoxy-6-polyprenyl-1,4-benzoquinol methylase
MSIDPITGGSRTQFVQSEFSAIARRYELMNQLMTFGQVNRLRRAAIQKLQLKSGMRVLDHGAGSGQISRQITKLHPGAHIFASDLNAEMIVSDGKRGALPFSLSDARKLPFQTSVIDRFICGFLLRNISDYPNALLEIQRVLKPGGIFVSLDTTPLDAGNLMRPLIQLYMRVMIPLVGALITGRFGAYKYLIKSSEGFTPADQLETDLTRAGFIKTGYQKMMFGAFAIHWGQKPLL